MSKEMVFKNNGDDFSGIYAAKKWLKENGYSYGSLQRNDPVGILKGDFNISKWRNLSAEDAASLDGRITFQDGGPRSGTAIVSIYGDAT